MAPDDGVTPPLVVVLVGAESTGKTTLAHALSARFDAPVVPEVARDYLAERGGRYDTRDLLAIAALQADTERRIVARGAPLVIADTDLIVIKVWWETRFGCTVPRLERWIRDTQRPRNRRYLLPQPDIPWEADPLRENPLDRAALHARYVRALKRRALPFVEVAGDGAERIAGAQHAIDQWLIR